MSQIKKNVRGKFRDEVFARDSHRCRKCGRMGRLDAHHITDRNLMPNGGYVLDNGISLCDDCHELAEKYHSTGTAHPGYAPAELYISIGSSYEKAFASAQRLGK